MAQQKHTQMKKKTPLLLSDSINNIVEEDIESGCWNANFPLQFTYSFVVMSLIPG
jgi:hypothetical protein